MPVEYALLAGLIGGALTGFAGVGSALADRFTQTTDAVSGPAESGTSTSPGNSGGRPGNGRGGRHR